MFDEIRVAISKFTQAYNSGAFNIADFYTEDCIIALPECEPLQGRPAAEIICKHVNGSSHQRQQIRVVDEIGPTTSTNLCYIRGHCIDYGMGDGVARTVRCDIHVYKYT